MSSKKKAKKNKNEFDEELEIEFDPEILTVFISFSPFESDGDNTDFCITNVVEVDYDVDATINLYTLEGNHWVFERSKVYYLVKVPTVEVDEDDGKPELKIVSINREKNEDDDNK